MGKLLALLLAVVLASGAAFAGEAEVALPNTERTPGVDLAEGLAQITGTAISPLLGVSVVGAWTYYGTPTAQREHLPWYARPWAWGSGFSILLLLAGSGLITSVLPGLSKLVKLADVVEDKASALLASTAVAPLIAVQMSKHALATPDVVLDGMRQASAFSLGQTALGVVFVIVALLVFGVVWLANHAINVLILLSPFVLVDSALRLFKGGLFVIIIGLAALSPVLAVIACVLLIAVCWWIAPWAFRLTVFGSVLSFDLLLPWMARKRRRPASPHAFLASGVGRVAVRTYGRLEKGEGGDVVFVYRPWLLLPERRIPMAQGQAVLCKGLMYPSLAIVDPRCDKSRDVASLLPRYRGSEGEVAGHLGITELRENVLRRGVAALRGWFASMFGFVRGSGGAAKA